MLSYIQMPDDWEFQINAAIKCDWPGCPKIATKGYSDDLMLSQISVLAIEFFTEHGWVRNVPVPITHRVVTESDDLGNPVAWGPCEETRPGDCCPEHAEQGDGE